VNAFEYQSLAEVGAALAAVDTGPDPAAQRGRRAFLAGGTNLLDLMKENVARPSLLLDINRLPLDRIEALPGGGLRIGALVRNAATAYHPQVREQFPLLSKAILAGASPQIRNMASNGGNLLQRTRCYYFYDAGVPCNKRTPGSGCPAIGGLARQHAILGASAQCIATHPSDMCVALAALAASVHVASGRGARTIPFADFHRLPGDRPELDTTLEPDELILSIDLPAALPFAAHCAYLKIRERASYAFALASVAVALDLDADGRIREARIAVGGVAHKPWRVPGAESLLAGERPTAEAFGRAADALLDGAVAQGAGVGSNAFKIALARRVIVRGLEVAAQGRVSPGTAQP
jgi:xanthine dehydrogenase YagS FAD-binding subunit